MRFVAASLVIASHSFALTGNVEPKVGNVNLGLFAVWIFFVISGYLISQSWVHHPHFGAFMTKRGLRIFPALSAVCILSVLGLGFVSTLGYIDYLRTPGVLQYLNNIMLFNTSYVIPGVFADNLYPDAVNGALWTLPYEFTMYLVLGVIGTLGWIVGRKALGVWVGLLVLNVLQLDPSRARSFHVSLFYLDAAYFSQLALMFFSGVAVYVLRHRLTTVLRSTWLPAFACFFAITHYAPEWAPVVAGMLLGVGVIGFCELAFFRGFGRYGDFSYGIYVYGFPLQQLVGHLTHTTRPLTMFMIAFPASVAAGALSWHLLEARCIRLKRRIEPRREAPAT